MCRPRLLLLWLGPVSIIFAVLLPAGSTPAQPVAPVRIFNSNFDAAPMSQRSCENFKNVGLAPQTGALNGGRAYGHFNR